jgi:transposase
MHLDYSRSEYKGKVYTSYRISRSVRRGDRVTKEVLFPLGQLSPVQAKQIALILRVVKSPDDVLVRLQDVIPIRAVSYLDVAVANHFWDEWGLDLALPDCTESELSTRQIARILTVNRCVSPRSHYAIPQWIRKTALPEMLNIPVEHLNDDKIYYELDKIEQNKAHIEKHLLEVTRTRDPESYRFVNYDLSTAYFVGIRCELSRFGKGKDNQPYQRQVVLAILVNANGYPFKWDVFPGNQAEVRTLEANVEACRNLGMSSVTMVFDRGLVSEDNLEMLARKNVKYITALDKPQILKVPGIDLRPFGRLPEKGAEEHLKTWRDFQPFDDKVFYKDLGVIEGKRHVLSINTALLREERKLRRRKFLQFERFVRTLNVELAEAKRDREAEATLKKVQAEVRKLKLTRFYEEPVLKPIKVRPNHAKGRRKTVASFQVKIKRIPAAVADAKLLDGVCVFISNHVEVHGRAYAMKAEQIIQAYRDKTEIEDAFKNMKSFLNWPFAHSRTFPWAGG